MNRAALATLLTFPVRLLHEVTHVAAAIPWADDWAVLIGRDGAHAHIEWADGAPDWAAVVSSYAPAAVGGVVALVLAAYLALTQQPLPDDLVGVAWWATGAAAWALYAAPTPADQQAATEAMADE
jgi:hypothetical protein